MKQIDSLVSVLLPIYNSEAYLAECLESLLKQAYDDLEVIAVDDLSSDRSYKILRAYAKQDKRLRVYRNIKRYGSAICLNRALKHAKGRYIAFMSPQDINSLHRIKRQVSFLSTQPKTVVIGTQCTFIDEKGRKKNKTVFPQEHDEIYQTLLHNLTMRYETALIDRQMLPKDILYFRTDKYPIIFSEVFVKLLQYGEFANLNQHLYYVRTARTKLFRSLSSSDKVVSFVRIGINAFAEHDYRPSFREFLKPFVSPIKTIFQ